MPGKGDINPETGKAYAVNPATGNWDDNYWAQVVEPQLKSMYGAGGGTGVNVPAFQFDYGKAEAEALAELEPYYRQILEQENGDVARAKKRIDEDYARGVRFRQEDHASDMRENDIASTQDTRDLKGNLNQRGVLLGEQEDPNKPKAPYSLYAQEWHMNPQAERQALRKQAIERALSRQNEIAGVEKQRNIEEHDIQLPRFQRALEQEKLNKARFEIVPYKRNLAYDKYQASTNPYMQGG